MALRRHKYSIGDQVVVIAKGQEVSGVIKMYRYDEINDRYSYLVGSHGWFEESEMSIVPIMSSYSSPIKEESVM